MKSPIMANQARAAYLSAAGRCPCGREHLPCAAPNPSPPFLISARVRLERVSYLLFIAILVGTIGGGIVVGGLVSLVRAS